MQGTLERPLNNQELAQHLAIQSALIHSGDPQVPGYVPPEERSMHEASTAWLVRHADHAEDPLVTVGESGEHVLAAESLMADADELRSWLSDDIRSLKRVIEDPDEARRTIWKDRERSGLGDQEAASYRNGVGNLSVAEAKAYLNTIRETAPMTGESDRDMHSASVDVAFALLDSWKQRQDPEGGLKDVDMKLELHASSANPDDSRTLYTHLVREQHRHEQKFHDLNEARIRDLGELVLHNTPGVREQVEENLNDSVRRAGEVRRAREHQQRMNISTSRTADDTESGAPETVDDEVARYREMLKGMNISTSRGRTVQPSSEASPEEAKVDAEKSRLAAVEQAAREGILLSWEPQGNTSEERANWARVKAQQIRELALLPLDIRKLYAEQSDLIPIIHQEGYGGEAQARYKQIAAICNVRTFQTSDPDIIEQVLREITPVLGQYSAGSVDEVLREIREAHARKPKAQFAFTFNRNADDARSKTFDFMHTMPNWT